VSKIRLIIDVEGELPRGPGAQYFHSLPHGRARGGKEIILRDTDIVQAMRLGPSHTPKHYEREIARYQKILARDTAEGRDAERLTRVRDAIVRLNDLLVEAERHDGEVLRTRYRYGIVFSSDAPDDLHRGPMTYDEAQEWMNGWYEICDNEGGKRDAFRIVRQPVGEWDYEVSS